MQTHIVISDINTQQRHMTMKTHYNYLFNVSYAFVEYDMFL